MPELYGNIDGYISLNAGQIVRRNVADTDFEAFTPSESDHSHVADDISDATAVGKDVLTATDAAEARSAIGVGEPTQASASRSLNTNFVPSGSRGALVNYSVDIAATISLTAGQSGTVFLEISADGSTDWQEVARFTNGNSGTLTIGLNLTQTNTGQLSGFVPAGWTARLRTANNSGTPTFTYRSGQEVAL